MSSNKEVNWETGRRNWEGAMTTGEVSDVLERGERAQLLLDKTNTLMKRAQEFKAKSAANAPKNSFCCSIS